MVDFALAAERQQGMSPRGLDLSGLVPAALSADHDDHAGSAARRAPAGNRNGHGVGAAAPARDCCGRRAARLAIFDALHDSSHLSRFRPSGAAFRRVLAIEAEAEHSKRYAAVTRRQRAPCCRRHSNSLLGSRGVNFSEIFIRRPVATVLLTVGAVLLGFIAYYRLPIASLPNMDRPTISVRSYLPGGSPDTIASSAHGAAGKPAWAHFRTEGDVLHQHFTAIPA